MRHVAELLDGSTFSSCFPALIDAAERDRALRRFHHSFQAAARQPLIDLIAAGAAAGELPAHVDPELAAIALLGAVFFRRLMTNEPFAPAQAGRLLDTVFGPAAKGAPG